MTAMFFLFYTLKFYSPGGKECQERAKFSQLTMTFHDFHNIEETKFDIYISKLFSTNKHFKLCAGIQG